MLTPRKNNNSLEEWDLFVLSHCKKGNIFFHLISFIMFWMCPILAIIISPWYIIGFFLSGFVGIIGHFLFDDGLVSIKQGFIIPKETNSSIQTIYFSSMMILMCIFGLYKKEIKISKKKYKFFSEGKINCIANLNGRYARFINE